MGKTLTLDASAPRTASLDPGEVQKFEAIAAEWWSPTGKFAPLHKFNPTRIGWIRSHACRHFGRDEADRTPLAGLRVLDVGCGGGLVSEPMARLGARVTGLDAGEANIKAAIAHAQGAGLDLDYRIGTVEGLRAAGEGGFDIVLALEIVEHVPDAARFLSDCAAMV
jgi:2-polyprenyl-6-hydroxyphenyl methylase / 3-demethylubiquinone-9 3-methyltransferase